MSAGETEAAAVPGVSKRERRNKLEGSECRFSRIFNKKEKEEGKGKG